MTRFFDTSALAKRYVPEIDSDSIIRDFELGDAALSRLAEVEAASAIWRRFREGDLGAHQRDLLLETLDHDLEVSRVIEVVPEVVANARSLLSRHLLRAGDAIQLASALYLQRDFGPVRFICFDQRLTAAAEREGLLPA